MNSEVFYTKKARTDLKSFDHDIAVRIIRKIKKYSQSKNPLIHAKKLKNLQLGTYRFRIGNYRALFDIEKSEVKVLMILAIKHRKDIYQSI